MIEAVGFDLDNTLYNQDDFALSFYRAISPDLAAELHQPAERIEACLTSAWNRLTSRHPRLFNIALAELGVDDPDLVRRLIHAYHAHRPKLRPFTGVNALLASLGRRWPLFLITDGNAEMQRTKIRALDFEAIFSPIVLTGELGPGLSKPSPVAFRLASEELGVAPESCVFVGDNPQCDFAGARSVGMLAVRVLTGPFADEPALGQAQPDHVIADAVALPALIDSLRPHG